MGLGINKDLEPLARRVKRMGGAVEITRSNHVRWVLPDGTVLRTGLTMHDSTARQRMRAIESALRRGEATALSHSVQTGGDGKYVIVETRTNGLVRNTNGHSSRFGTKAVARHRMRKMP
jgi:hypothetical protein